MKTKTFIILQLNFIFSISSFIYIDLISELIDKTANASHYFNKVTLSDLYVDAIIIFFITFIPSRLLTYLFFRVKNNKLWIIPIFLIYTMTWFFVSYAVVSGYVEFFGHTWLEIEIFAFTLGQNYIFIAYITSLIFVLSYLKKEKIY